MGGTEPRRQECLRSQITQRSDDMRGPRNKTSILTGLILFGLMSLLIVIRIASSAALPQPPPSCTPPPSGLVSWWPGDGNALDVQDSNDGTLQGGATFAAGEVGQGFSFSGTAQYVDVGSVNLPSTFTIDAWINPSDLSAQPMILSKDDGGSSRSYYFELGSFGQFGAEVITSAGDTQYGSVSGAVVTNAWQHVAMTYDGSAGADQKIKFYVNGALIAAAHLGSNDNGGTPNTTSLSTKIGIYGDASNLPFKGLIDEVEVFNRALSASEILAIAAAGSAGKCRTCAPPPSGMVSWWPGDGTPSDIADSNNGTLQGATYASGKVGQAFSFSSNGDEVLVPHNDNQNTGAQITVDAWIYIPNALSEFTTASIINKRSANDDEGYTFEIVHAPPNGTQNGLQFEFETTTAPSTFQGISIGQVITPGVWQHVAATYDGSAVTLYVDGRQVQQSGTITGIINPVTDDLVIGKNIVNGGSFPGLIDEVELFNRALTANEIKAIVNAGSAGKCKPTSASADLDIHKSSSSDTVVLGQNVSYKIEVENEGPSTATDVTITDTLPASLTNISAPGCNVSGQTVTCIIPSLANGQEVTRTITAKTTATGKITNTASVTADEPDPDLSNNSDKESTKVVVGVKSLSLDPSTVKGGRDVTGTVKLSGSASSNTVVTLFSSNTSAAKPAVSSVTISAGNTSKNFTVKTFAVSSTKTVKIKASANGTSKEATLTVTH